MGSVHQDLRRPHCKFRDIKQEKSKVCPSYSSCSYVRTELEFVWFFSLKFKILTVFTQAHYPQGESMKNSA